MKKTFTVLSVLGSKRTSERDYTHAVVGTVNVRKMSAWATQQLANRPERLEKELQSIEAHKNDAPKVLGWSQSLAGAQKMALTYTWGYDVHIAETLELCSQQRVAGFEFILERIGTFAIERSVNVVVNKSDTIAEVKEKAYAEIKRIFGRPKEDVTGLTIV